MTLVNLAVSISHILLWELSSVFLHPVPHLCFAVRQRLKEVPQQLAQLPSANSLSAEQLTFLLGEAVRQQLPAAVSALCKLQPATQLGLQFVAQQLQQSLKLKMDCQSVEALCGLLLLTDERQAALDAATFNAVLELALERQHLRPVAALLDTPVAERELNVQRVQQLLLHAVEQHNDSAVDILVGLDAAQGIAEPDVQRLFEAGIRVGCCGMMMVSHAQESRVWSAMGVRVTVLGRQCISVTMLP